MHFLSSGSRSWIWPPSSCVKFPRQILTSTNTIGRQMARDLPSSAALGNGDNNWWIAELFTLDGCHGLMKSIYKPPYQIANPVWSPKGDQIAFVEGLMSDEGLTGGDVFTIAASGGGPEHHSRNESIGKLASLDSR